MTRALLLALLAISGNASADDRADVAAVLKTRSADKTAAALGDSVRAGPMLFSDEGCRKRFAAAVTLTGAARRDLAMCLETLYLEPSAVPFAFTDTSYGAL